MKVASLLNPFGVGLLLAEQIVLRYVFDANEAHPVPACRVPPSAGANPRAVSIGLECV